MRLCDLIWTVHVAARIEKLHDGAVNVLDGWMDGWTAGTGSSATYRQIDRYSSLVFAGAQIWTYMYVPRRY